MQSKSTHSRMSRVAGAMARGAIAASLAITLAPSAAMADEAATTEGATTEAATTVTSFKDLYTGKGIDTSKGYDVVTSATSFSSRHVKDIATSVDQVKDSSGSTYALDGVTTTSASEATVTPKLSSATVTYGATRGDVEFVIQPDDTVSGYKWNDYYNKIYAVTVSDGTNTAGAVPWIDWYGENAESGYHYNKLEVTLNNGTSKGSNKQNVTRFAAFYDENGNVKAGTYTITVYADGYANLEAKVTVLPTYAGTVTASGVYSTSSDVTLSGLPQDIKNAKASVTYTVGSGRNAKVTTLADAAEVKDGKVSLDTTAYESLPDGAELAVTITSDNYADIDATTSYTTAAEQVAVYRLYNPYDALRLYTTDKDEYDELVSLGWNGEEVGWQSPAAGTPVYRLYNQYNGEHLYTTDKDEYDARVQDGWSGEDVAFYSATEEDGTAVKRFYNPWITGVGSTHHYTLDETESATMVADGWQDEGVAFYAAK